MGNDYRTIEIQGKGVTWHLKGNGGIFSTVEDMYRWCQALLSNQVLPAIQTKKLFHAHVSEGENVSSSYAYGWSIQENSRGEKVITHNGGNGFYMATVAMIPARDAVLIVSCSHAPKNTDVISERIDRLVFENLKPLEESWISQYSGMYALPSGATFQVNFNENDEAISYLNNSETYLLLAGSKSEDAEKVKEMNRTAAKLLASLSQNEVKNIEDEDLADLRRQMQQNLGAVKTFEVLGSVSRRDGEFYLTPVKLGAAKGEFYRLFIWRNGKLFDLRELPEGNTKEFEYQSANEFYSESNDLRISFTTIDGKPALTIHAKKGDVIAYSSQTEK